MSFHVSTATFLLLHCDEWDRVVALPRHKFVTGATLLQLRSCEKIILFCSLSIISCSHNLLFCSHKKDIKPKDLTPVREGKTEKSQKNLRHPKEKISRGCLRFLRLALLPVFDSFSH